MAAVGHVLLGVGLITTRGQLMLTGLSLLPQVLTRRVTMLVGTVSPSAVWYTN